jgi:gliding motility-associated-like protein
LGSITGITTTGTNLTYSWSNNGGSIISPSGLTSGSYTLTVTDGNGCTAVSSPLTIPFTSGPSIDTSQAVFSVEHCGQSDGGISGITATGTGLQYQWTPGNSNSINLNNVSAGQYTLVVTDQNNCTDTVGPLTIQATTPPLIDTSSIQVLNELCGQNNGGISGITVSGGTAPLTYLWSNQQNTLNIPNGLAPGSYSLVVTDNAGCMDSITGITIGSTGGPSIDSTQLLITPVGCSGEPGSITGITSNGNGIQYSWNNSVNTADNNNLTAGTYVLTVTDANNCASTLTVVVPQLNPVVLDESQVTLLNPTCLVDGSITGLSVSGGTNNYSYSWQPGNMNTLNLQNLTAGNYILVASDANGCSDTSTIYTLVNPSYPNADFTFSPSDPDVGELITFTNSSSNYTIEQWIIDGITYSQSPWDSSFNAGVYPVQLTVTNAAGCQDTITYNVVVYDELTFPNVITPNGDLSNDYLEIEALKPNSEISIVNRWGNVVYKSTNYQNDWDGKDQQGVDLKEGVYTVIFITSENKRAHFYVHLIR